MKKVLLTSALGCAMITSAFAENPPNGLNNEYGFSVIDYISMSPNGGPFPQDELQKTFNENNSFDMNTPFVVDATPFLVTASRSWHVTFDASDFLRTAGQVSDPNAMITTTLPVGEVFSIEGVGTTANVSGTTGFEAASNTPQIVIEGKGGMNNGFTLATQMNVSQAMSEYNIEGTYISTMNVIASLD